MLSIWHLLILLCPWICVCSPIPGFHQTGVHFVKAVAASSFSSRTDHFVDESWKLTEAVVPHYVPLTLGQQDVHITPDFSDGLAYPDPFLRTDPSQAKFLVKYLYSKELFFSDIPHERSLLYNQEQRIKNGLRPHNLGSLRPGTPWYRYKYEDNTVNSLY